VSTTVGVIVTPFAVFAAGVPAEGNPLKVTSPPTVLVVPTVRIVLMAAIVVVIDDPRSVMLWIGVLNPTEVQAVLKFTRFVVVTPVWTFVRVPLL
jgi:hypothetical protein